MEKEESHKQQEKEPAKKEAEQEAEPKPATEGESTFCKNCQKEVIPVFEHGRWKCPNCKLFVKTKGKKVKGELGAGEEGEKKDFKMTSLRPIALGGKDMALAEVLVNAGVAKDFSDLTRKGLHVLYQGLNLPFSTNTQMETNTEKGTNPDPKRTMKELQEQKMMETYIDGMKGNPTSTLKELQEQKLVEAYIKNMNKGDQTDPLQMMMLMRMMDNRSEGRESSSNNFMKDVMQLQMIKSLGGGDNQQVATLQREISDMKMMQQMQNLQKNTPSVNDQLMALEKIRADRDVKIKDAELEAQNQRDQTLKIAMDSKLKELEKGLDEARQSGGHLGTQRIRELREEMEAIKEMATVIGTREKGTGEMVMEGLGKVAENVAPALIEMGKQRQQQQIAPPYQPPEPMMYPPGSNPPQENQNLGPELEPGSEPGFPMPKSEMTPSEKEMADTMSDMYIKEKK